MQKGKGKYDYRSVIIAGLGSVGRAMLVLGRDFFGRFDKVVIADKNPDNISCVKKLIPPSLGCEILEGDVTEDVFLTKLLCTVKRPGIFINLCQGIDTTFLRKRLSRESMAYVDISAGCINGSNETRFSRIMPYNNMPIHGEYPQLICMGINPGLVEVMVRLLIRKFDNYERRYDVNIFEYDSLHAYLADRRLAVGWSVEDFVEELMLSPALRIADGKVVEEKTDGALHAVVNWNGFDIHALLAGHEDIYNLGQMEEINSANFFYSLHPEVMNILKGGSDSAVSQLCVPSFETSVHGVEKIVVHVRDVKSNSAAALMWRTDHHAVWLDYKLNAVQYQTAISTLLFLRLLVETELGSRAGTFSGSTIPLEGEIISGVEKFMPEMGINPSFAAKLKLMEF